MKDNTAGAIPGRHVDDQEVQCRHPSALKALHDVAPPASRPVPAISTHAGCARHQLRRHRRVVTMISAKVFSPLKKWLKLKGQRHPKAIWALAKLMSASNNMTR
jgi:hypothetical protein